MSITDGDTVRLQASSGTAPLTTSVTKVRLLELDTPETKDPNAPVECFGPQASAYTARLLPVGSTVWVTADRELLDRYGRTLLYLWRPDGLFVNREIVRQGYARAVLYEPNDRYIATMRTAENEARKAGRGLWSACASPSTSAAINQFASKPATTQPAPSPSTAQGAACEPAYPDVCIPPYATAGDLDCGDIPYRRFRVLPPDPDRFDSDHDGIGCESG